jgi:hypothetical protein
VWPTFVDAVAERVWSREAIVAVAGCAAMSIRDDSAL